MTSYIEPNFDLSLKISERDFHHISGIAFDTFVAFSSEQANEPCMLIIPQTNIFPDSAKEASAWLWFLSEESQDIPVGTKIIITLEKTCDPMHTPEECTAMALYNGLTIEGTVTRIWDADE